MVDRTLSTRNGYLDAPPSSTDEFSLDRLRFAVRGICYGEVRVIIQDGQIVQIDRLERQRLR